MVSVVVCVMLILLAGCSSSRHVPDGDYLLDKVKLQIVDSARSLDKDEMMTYVRHQPNHKMLWSVKLRLGVYNMSGRDTTKWWNRWIRKIGEAPVIYDSAGTRSDALQLLKAMENKGYLNAEVETDTLLNSKKRKMSVTYKLYPGIPHKIKSINYEFPSDSIAKTVMADSQHFTVRAGDNLDRELLEQQREIVTNHLRNRGYYGFAKEFIVFNADTTEGSSDVDLTMRIVEEVPKDSPSYIIPTHEKYIIGRIFYITEYDPAINDNPANTEAKDTVGYKNITILYGDKKYLTPSVLYDNCFLRTGELYHESDVNRTYEALARLPILKFVSIRFIPVGEVDGHEILDAYICLTRGKSQTFAVEVEGTNSEGDLGVALAASYSHLNVGKGSETLSARGRVAYESLSGNLEGLIHNRYLETMGEVSVTFPKFKAPFLWESFKRKVRASTELNISMSYQERPEYTRIVTTAGWAYSWIERHNRNRHTFKPIDINYVYLPESTYDFINQIAPDNPLLRYSYEDHFIMRMGYTFYHTNKKRELPWDRVSQRNIYTIRASSEIAGNLLFALSNIFDHRSNFRSDPYRIFGIRYSQYVKVEGDFSYLRVFDPKNSFACHFGLGVGVPYGNSTILPFEKRFYGGGANGVRGWDVRTLGPGRYPGTNSVSDFINQCGDIRLEMNTEYRAKLFWIIELGAFIDVGNIWTIHNYSNQPGGMFHFNSFYKELAAAYGLGLRLDFNYFLIRFDLGMKAHNPAINQEPWPLIHPNWHRDSSFHFSIGYPF